MTWELGAQSYHFAHFTNTAINESFADEETFRFSKVHSAFTLYFNPAEKKSGYSSSLTLNASRIEQQVAHSILSSEPCNCDPNTFSNVILNETKYFTELNFRGENQTAINPFSFSVGFRLNTDNDLFRATAEGNYRFSYKGRNRGLDVRLFMGSQGLEYTESVPPDYRFRMNGYSASGDYTYKPTQDYMFDHVFLGRTETEGILSRQFVATEGGFKVPTVTGQSSTWLIAMNFKTSLPGRLPIKFFTDIGWYDAPDKNFMYDYGFELTLIQNVFSIYIPVGYSQDIQDYYDAQAGDPYGNWYDRIRFELRLERLNPVKLIRTITF
jgi:hypothetical protein